MYFDDLIFNQSNVLLYIEGRKFGAFFQKELNDGDKAKDENCYLVDLSKSEIIKHNSNTNISMNNIKLFLDSQEKLIEIGNGDIVIIQRNQKTRKFYRRSDCFVYNENKINGNEERSNMKEEKESFSPKRIQVFQLGVDEEKVRKEIEQMKKQLVQKTEEIISNKPKEIISLEENTFTEFKEIVFDSDLCDWSMKSNSFNEIIIGKKQVIILVETKANRKFGCFIDSVIKNGKSQEKVFDSVAFTYF